MLRLDAYAQAEDRFASDPPVDSAAIVTDLKTIALNRFDEVKVLMPSHFAKHNIANLERPGVFDGNDGAELT